MTLVRSIRAAAFTALLGWAGQAAASPITYDSYSVLNNQTVHVVDTNLGLDEYSGAGQITLNGGTMPGGALATWCVDIGDLLLNGGSFASRGTLFGAFADKVNALISNGTQLLASDRDASAALQVAIWKVEYGAELSVTSDSSSMIALADRFVANVSGADPVWRADGLMAVSVLQANGANQDQAFLTAVPEPASVALLLAGLAGAAGVRRSRRAA